jgi:drug/metabolite transporter (DMT)-like permease
VSAPALRYRALLLAAATLFSTGGAAIKSLALTGWQIACFRSAVACAVLLLAIPETRRAWRWRIVPVSAAYAATLITFALANRLTTSADAIFLQFTAPFYLLLLGPWLLHEPVRRADLLYMAAVAAGMAVFFVGSEASAATAPDPRTGNLIAAVSGFTYALMLLGLRWLARQDGENAAVATVAIGNLLAFVLALPLALPVQSIRGQDVAILLYLGVVQIGLAYFCLTKGMGHVPALQAATLLAVEPALNPVWTWLVHGERPGGWPLAGGALILGATLGNTWRQSRGKSAAATS